MILGQAVEQFAMMDYANITLEQCWDMCYNRNLTRQELVGGDILDPKIQKMNACARKCVARNFEVMKLMMESREAREKEMMQQMA